jgi:hypothetical protein
MQQIIFSSPEKDRMSVEIILPNDRLSGLIYSTSHKKITAFFQEVDRELMSKL